MGSQSPWVFWCVNPWMGGPTWWNFEEFRSRTLAVAEAEAEQELPEPPSDTIPASEPDDNDYIFSPDDSLALDSNDEWMVGSNDGDDDGDDECGFDNAADPIPPAAYLGAPDRNDLEH